MRPCHSAQPEIRLIESGTDLITILRCFLSFETLVTSRNIIVFKKKFLPKNDHPSRAQTLLSGAICASSCFEALGLTLKFRVLARKEVINRSTWLWADVLASRNFGQTHEK